MTEGDRASRVVRAYLAVWADAALRAGLVSSMLVGVVTRRRIIGVPPLADAGIDELVAVLAPAMQQVLMPL